MWPNSLLSRKKWPQSAIVEYAREGSIFDLRSEYGFRKESLQTIRIDTHTSYIAIYSLHHRYFGSPISGDIAILGHFHLKS